MNNWIRAAYCVGTFTLLQAQDAIAQQPALVTSQEAFIGTDETVLAGQEAASGVELFTAGVDPDLIRADDGLVVWPVPAKDVLHIYCSGNNAGNMPFEIVSMTGRVVLRGSIQGGSANLIEVDDLAPGDHLLRLVDGRGVKQVVFDKAK